MCCPFFLNARGQYLNVAIVVVIVIHKAKLGQIARFSIYPKEFEQIKTETLVDSMQQLKVILKELAL